MFVRAFAAIAVLTFPVDAVAQCKPNTLCKRAAPSAPAIVPFKPKIVQPNVGSRAPAPGKMAPRPSGDVIAIPKINTPQPPARRPGATNPRIPVSQARQGTSGSVMRQYICQTPETYCRLNTFEVVESGAACHCRGVRGKIE